MSTLEMNFVNPCLWAQVTTLQAVLYKQHNQHRKEKYYQGLQRVITLMPVILGGDSITLSQYYCILSNLFLICTVECFITVVNIVLIAFY